MLNLPSPVEVGSPDEDIELLLDPCQPPRITSPTLCIVAVPRLDKRFHDSEIPPSLCTSPGNLLLHAGHGGGSTERSKRCVCRHDDPAMVAGASRIGLQSAVIRRL